ncbi:uromodulin-like 1 isoform X3 [Mauremys reevesii]|uniref:uromodulin-like 1 isoform X3 n=1 Tax=Mauremys reevesii TaxID=260615 RepID=UPI00193EE9AF|nr:uromodulin-like 1 isoform X3 [Mauremys reevesii]
MTKTVSKMVAYQKSYEKHSSCGGWIPWMVCLKTSYKTQYRIAEVPEIMNFTDCCEGYEQVGFYCTLSLNRSNEFASSPGVCPEEEMDSLNYSCTLDTDCPGLKKCCNSSKGTVCVDPVPEERNLKKYWYNVSVLVKMDFNELSGVDPRLLNHSRLLHSMMTGALWPLNSSVYHIQTTQAETYAGTLASQVLIGLHQPAPLMKVSSLLKGIVKRVYEVINIDVQDVNECSHAELNACSRSELCINLEGYYNCTCEHEHVDRDSRQPQKEFKDLSSIGNHRIVSVTSSSFEVSWNVNSTLNHTFQVQVYKGKELLRSMETTEMKMDVSGLEAGIKYTVKISYEACGKNIISYQNVKTDAQIFGVTIKILNYNFTEHFHNTSSSEYQEFSRLLLAEIENSFPPNISILYKTGKLKVQIESLKAGSIIVRLRIIVQDPEFPTDVSTFAPMLSSLYRSSVFLVDQQSTSVEDWDECASRSENDCCMYAECINLMGSYMCRCKTTMDTNPSRPGRNCEVPVPAQRIIFSSVTSISFHVAWSTESALNPAFRFLLLRENQLISEAKIQSTSLTVPGLEPGILYTVEIMTEVCGKESKPARQKVKTAVQKLNGSVRITNVKYTAGLNNASSEEYHNFTQLFLGEVRKSLPLNRLQEMDLGLIKMLITSITNGSIVVGFDLLTAKDLDIHNLSTAFHDVFKNSSYFTVDNNSLSIRDYDECEREEDDCSPDASCHNTYGSYQCSCNEGFADLNSERPGRNCEAFPLSLGPTTAHGKHVGSTSLPVTRPHTSAHVFSPATEDSSAAKTKAEEGTMFSSTAMPHASTASVSNARSSPHVTTSPLTKTSQGMSLKDAVRVFCEIEKIVIAIQKIFLQQESIPESALYLGEPHCNVSFSNDTHVVLWTGWNGCGTKVQSNMTKTIVKTILRNDNSSQEVIHNLKIVCPIHCVFQNNLLTSSGYSSEGVYTFFEDLHGSGYFITEMQLFVGNSSIPQNFSVSASDDILIEVGIQKEDSKLKVVVTECWATPTSNSGDPLSFGFINNSCPVPEAYTTMIENGNSRKAQFKLKIFSFVNNSVVYLHCKIRICVETSESTCRTSCRDVRSLKSGEIIATHRTSWGPLCRATASDSKSEKAAGLGVGSIVLIVIAVFVFVLGVAALSVSQYQRKTGRYNFKIKSDNFSYQVFYD